ncbi:predicted protein [Naegleria gruberi]|uniref:Predicted protein n=1 Tax=Naegleria gruberi TaxID=5762 RepID=D2VFT1_NAEGR|nr:uncharacterized protein NAEGRDRAFT_67732 [Naegleria gruberi]EFC44411.1 predicted protein [Naegleria gruberi]|eukprot:XP_002677155.1 predicted protein [Naegleria gruberi strain NEG-M]
MSVHSYHSNNSQPHQQQQQNENINTDYYNINTSSCNNSISNNNNNNKYFDEVNYDSTLGAYSNEDLYKDCERMIQQQYGLKPSSPFRDLKFHLIQEIFSSITKYIHQQVENFKSVSINNIGRFSFITSHLNTGNNGIIESKKLVFVMSESFIRDFNLKICKSYRKFVDNSIPTMEVNYFLIAQQCCTRKEIVMLAIRMFRNRLGEIMSTGKKVLIEFTSIGQLKCDKRIVSDFDFIDKFRKPLNSKQQNKHETMKKKFNRIMSREDLKLLNKMRIEHQQQEYTAQPPQTSRSMIYSTRSSVSGGSIRNPFTIIHDMKTTNNRPLSSSASSIRSYHSTSRISNQQLQQQQQQFARGNGVNAVRNLQNHQPNTLNYEPHPPSIPRPPPTSSLSSQRLTRETLDTFNRQQPPQQQNQTVLPSDFVESQFSPSTNYGPYDNGFRQPNPTAAKNVMNMAVKRFEKELESSRRNQQKELDDFYRQLIHNVCASEELRRKQREEASNIQNTLLNQMQHTGAKRQIEDHEYCNFFLDERDENLNANKNALLMGFKKSKNNERNAVSKSLPSIPSLQAMKPIQKIMLNENNPIEKGLRIPDKHELFDYYNEFN